jgi:hypothetical protein
MHPIVLNPALLVTYTVAKTYTAYMLPKSVCFITQMQARRSTSGHIFFRKRALARVALSGSWKVYTLRERSRRGADPRHGVAHNMNHRNRWGTIVVLTKH